MPRSDNATVDPLEIWGELDLAAQRCLLELDRRPWWQPTTEHDWCVCERLEQRGLLELACGTFRLLELGRSVALASSLARKAAY